MIGLLGASGGVGAATGRLLARHVEGGLLVGSRRPEAVTEVVSGWAEPRADVTVARVDVADDTSLAAFVRGCSLVVDCAGPSAGLAARAARAAWAAGADHVDAGGDAGVAAALARDPAAATRRAVLAAGAWPGLSGLLPRWLAARELTTTHALIAYVGVRDRFTPGAASDFLDGALDGTSEPLAAWRDGRRRSGALTRRVGEAVPFFPGEVAALPYLDDEGDTVAQLLGLSRADWYSVVPEAWSVALDHARTRPRSEAVADLCRAAELDAAGQPPSTTFLAQLDGETDGAARTRTALLRGPGVSEVTAAVTAVTALAVLHGEVEPGAHVAAAALDPLAAVAGLAAMGVGGPDVLETSIAALATIEEGAL